MKNLESEMISAIEAITTSAYSSDLKEKYSHHTVNYFKTIFIVRSVRLLFIEILLFLIDMILRRFQIKESHKMNIISQLLDLNHI
jgi:hypothetical protein